MVRRRCRVVREVGAKYPLVGYGNSRMALPLQLPIFTQYVHMPLAAGGVERALFVPPCFV